MWGILALGVHRSGVFMNVEALEVRDPCPRRSSTGVPTSARLGPGLLG